MEDDLQWKTTFGGSGRRPLMEDNFWWKMTYRGRPPSVEVIIHVLEALIHVLEALMQVLNTKMEIMEAVIQDHTGPY